MPEVFQGTPAWYSGTENSPLRQLIDAYMKLRNEQAPRYPGSRIASQNARQEQARRLAQQIIDNPAFEQMFNQGRQSLGRAANVDTRGTAEPYIQRATESPTIGIGQYMNPYQGNVVQNMADFVKRNLTESLLPSLQGNYLASGQKYGSGRRDNAIQTALRGANEAIARESGQLMHRGYEDAMRSRLANQQANLQGGLGLAGAQARDTEQQSQAALALGNLSGQQQVQNLRGADVMNQLGAQDQALQQSSLNTGYQDWKNQVDYPQRHLAFLSEGVRGLTPNVLSSFAPEAPVTPFMPSSWTGGAGMVGLGSGLQGMSEEQRRRGYAHGGRVKMAGGGNPLADGVQDAMDNEDVNALRNRASELEAPPGNLTGAPMARMGLGLLSHNQPTYIPGQGYNPKGGAMTAFGNAGQGALDEYQNQLNLVDRRRNNAANIHEVINRTRQWQQHQQQQQSQFEAKRAHQNAQLGLEREKFNFFKEQAIQPKVDTKRLDKEYGKVLEKANEGSKAAGDMRDQLQIMKFLKPSIGPTGPVSGALPHLVATLGGSLGDTGHRQVFESAGNTLLASILATQKGSQSDSDLAVFATTKPGVNKTEKANDLMIEYGDKVADRVEQYEQHLLDSKEQGKSLGEAKREWKKYVNANPIIKKEKEGEKKDSNVVWKKEEAPGKLNFSDEAIDSRMNTIDQRMAELEGKYGNQTENQYSSLYGG